MSGDAPGPPSEASPDIHAAVLDSVSDGVYVVDTERRITYWNPAAARITGYDAERATGRWCGDGLLNHVDEVGRPMCGDACPLLATIHDGQTRSTRAYLHHAQGHLTPVQVTAAPLRDGSGTIIGAVETFSDDTQARVMEQRLRTAETLAMKDPLTGLGNRRGLTPALEQRFAAWTRHGHRFGAVTIDVDRFKEINDTHGHDAGDRVLSVIARSLAHAVRGTDALFRTGGDEFVVLTGPIAKDELGDLAARLRMVVAASRYPTGAAVSISVGTALVEDGDDSAALLKRADDRLLRAKRSIAEDDDADGLATPA